MKEEIEKAAKALSAKEGFCNTHIQGIHLGFSEGANWMDQQWKNKTRWISVEERLPIAWETGNWDGKRSDFVNIKTKDGLLGIGRIYRGFIDGAEFNDWYDSDDCDGFSVTYWKEIEP